MFIDLLFTWCLPIRRMKYLEYNSRIRIQQILSSHRPKNETKRKTKAEGNYPDWVHSDQMVLGMVRQGDWTVWVVGRLDRLSSGQAGPLERWPKATQEGPSCSSSLRSDGSCDGQVGRLDCVSGGQKTLKAKLNLKGDYQTSVRSGHLVLMVVRQGGELHEQ